MNKSRKILDFAERYYTAGVTVGYGSDGGEMQAAGYAEAKAAYRAMRKAIAELIREMREVKP